MSWWALPDRLTQRVKPMAVDESDHISDGFRYAIYSQRWVRGTVEAAGRRLMGFPTVTAPSYIVPATARPPLAPIDKLAMALNVEPLPIRGEWKFPFDKIEVWVLDAHRKMVVSGVTSGAPFQLEDDMDGFPSQKLINALNLLRD